FTKVGSKIVINLPQEPNPIFKKQTEWLADFDILQKKLEAVGFSLNSTFLMNQDAVLPPKNLEFAGMNRVAVFQKEFRYRGQTREYVEDFQINVLPVGEQDKGEKWIRSGIKWDTKSFIRSFLFTIGTKDSNGNLVDMGNKLAKFCTPKNFNALEGGKVRARLVYDLIFENGNKSEMAANKAALAEYKKRCEDTTVGHEASGLLLLIYPNRKIIIIDEEGKEYKRYGTGAKTSYIQKVSNYAYSPLTKAPGYVHVQPPVPAVEEIIPEKNQTRSQRGVDTIKTFKTPATRRAMGAQPLDDEELGDFAQDLEEQYFAEDV
ncbi:MAG: hypothetical protein ABJA64_00005, partial [Candidatus Saccharibacteria bacterium]